MKCFSDLALKTRSINWCDENTDDLQDEVFKSHSKTFEVPSQSLNWWISIYMIHPREQSSFRIKYCGNRENATDTIHMLWEVTFLEILCKTILTCLLYFDTTYLFVIQVFNRVTFFLLVF